MFPLRNYLARLICLLWIVAFVSGCASQTGYQNVYKTLSLTKGTVENLASVAKRAHEQGLIDDVLIGKIQEVYERLQKAQGIVIEKQKELLDVRETLNQAEERKLQDDIKATQGIYLRMVTEFINLALEAGIVSAGDVKEGV